MSEFEQHDAQWNDLLQDLIDGELIGQERVALEAHIANCPRCRARHAKLRRLDQALNSKIEAPPLTPAFDQQVFARIHAMNEQAQEHARRRLERELHDNLQALARTWRRSLLSVIGGAIAGVALALAFVNWAGDATIAKSLVSAATNSVGHGYANIIHVLVTALIGAAIGAGVSRLMSATVD